MKLISEIKLKTRSLKDKRKNIDKLLNCFSGKDEPDCYFSCKRYEDFNKMDARGQSCYYINLLDEHNKLTKQIDIIGKSILELRGNKWRISNMKIELRISPTEGAMFKISFNMENGVVTTQDIGGLINQEKVDKDKLPTYIKNTVDKLISDWEKKQ